MNSARKGNAAELRTQRLLESAGWVVAQRRHVGGAGDLLAVRAGEPSRLIEVKDRKNVWGGFRREDRRALVEAARVGGCTAELAWFRPGVKGPPVFLLESDWPKG